MVKSDVLLYQDQMNSMANGLVGAQTPSAGLDAAILYRHWAHQLQQHHQNSLRLPPPPLLPLASASTVLPSDSEDLDDPIDLQPNIFHPFLVNPFYMVGRETSWTNQRNAILGERRWTMKEGCDGENGGTRRTTSSSSSSSMSPAVKKSKQQQQHHESSTTTTRSKSSNAAVSKISSDVATTAAANMSTLTGGFAMSNNRNTNGSSQTASAINSAKAGTPKQKSEGPPRDKIFVCAVCNRCFGYKHVLQNHERTHTGEKPFECKECHKRFTRDHHLKTHMRLHTGEKPYHCTHCERQFVQVANLRRHLRVHTGERPYACELCTSKFSDSNQLKAHMLIHKGEKPFECQKCMGRFRRRHHLMHHKCPKDEANIGKPRRGRRPKAYDAMLTTPTMGIIPTSIIGTTTSAPPTPVATSSVSNNIISNVAIEQFTSPSMRLKPKRKPSHTQRILPTLAEHRIYQGEPTMQTQALDMRVSSSVDVTALALDLIHARMAPISRRGAGSDDNDDDAAEDDEDVEDVNEVSDDNDSEMERPSMMSTRSMKREYIAANTAATSANDLSSDEDDDIVDDVKSRVPVKDTVPTGRKAKLTKSS